MAQLGLLYEVISDIRRLDRCGTNDASFRWGVRSAIAERLPPVNGSADWPSYRLIPGSTAGDAADMIATALLRNAGPATALLARLAGAPVTVEVTCAAHRALTPGEAALFGAGHGTRAYEREGVMTAGDLAVAATRLVLIPERLPGVAWGAIQEGQPAGEALGPYGMHRVDRKICLSRVDATVDASASLTLGDTLIGLAEERVTRELCEHAAAMA
ncbi:MAG: hypothetical protein WAL41_11860 [Mycobacterium sp.]